MKQLLLFALLAFALIVSLAASPGESVAGFVVVLGPLLFVWVALFVWSVVICVGSLRRKQWLLALIALVVPLVIPFAALKALPYARYPGDYAYFQTMRRSYDAQIARMPNNGKRYAEFNWGGMLFASRGVVYDQTDEVALPYGRQSAAWKKRMESTDLACGGDGPVGPVLLLGDHYYVTSFGC